MILVACGAFVAPPSARLARSLDLAAPTAPVLMRQPVEDKPRGVLSFLGGNTNSETKGKVVPTRQKDNEEEEELSIRELLSKYGVIALLFHFSVWVTCLASVYALLSFGLDIDGLLPDWLLPADENAAAEGAGVAG